MKIIILSLLINLIGGIGPGNIGRYEVELKTTDGKKLNAYLTVTTFQTLESEFNSNVEFENFLFNKTDCQYLDTLNFFKRFYFVDYPEYNYRSEKLISILPEDWIHLAKTDIEEIKFVSFNKIDFVSIRTKLNQREIKLLQTEPIFIDQFSIDENQEDYSNLWILSYNQKIKSLELSEIVQKFKTEYETKTTRGKDNENSWVYSDMMTEWRIKLKKMDVYIIEVTNP
jgi:hypothetical protein